MQKDCRYIEEADGNRTRKGKDMKDVSRYMQIETWARRRYSRAGAWATRVGNAVAGLPAAPSTQFQRGASYMVPTRYSMIEDLAARRYLDQPAVWPSFDLASAHNPLKGGAA